ncbi:MAG: thioredoxin family protein [Firmicutes bacterium]|nr:thioredoxin family protein [Bacillota bacterium]
MKNLKNIDKKKIGIIILLVLIVGLLVFGVIYAIKNHNRDDIKTYNNNNVKYTLSAGQLDGTSQPEVKVDVKYYILPETKSTLEEINVDTLKRLFQTEKKSLVIVSREDCSACMEYKPMLTKVLEKLGMSAYEINLSKLSDDETKELFKYIDYEVTPATYVIANSKVNHILEGSVDEDTLLSFIDYFYYRNN